MIADSGSAVSALLPRDSLALISASAAQIANREHVKAKYLYNLSHQHIAFSTLKGMQLLLYADSSAQASEHVFI